MTDCELLEQAAKAAGKEPLCWSRQNHGDRAWNPLGDDGDAFRLAMKLKMRVSVGQVDWAGTAWAGAFEDDTMAGTRRAIVRAAAAIGERRRDNA
jgi:hypothetical protein